VTDWLRRTSYSPSSSSSFFLLPDHILRRPSPNIRGRSVNQLVLDFEVRVTFPGERTCFDLSRDPWNASSLQRGGIESPRGTDLSQTSPRPLASNHRPAYNASVIIIGRPRLLAVGGLRILTGQATNSWLPYLPRSTSFIPSHPTYFFPHYRQHRKLAGCDIFTTDLSASSPAP
jgi:hypothetical protein